MSGVTRALDGKEPGEARLFGIMDHIAAPVFSPSPRFTATQGQYLAFIHTYTVLHSEPPAEADFQRLFQVTPPTVHAMVVALAADELPALEPIKTTGTGYSD